ncbi:MAG TPA: ATP synthase F1 subunit delta [Anaeromyxobacteraceae bacterium]|nr:ATP synthase F1 subunit delta [Anaeromyxobacteraceae bacterium]
MITGSIARRYAKALFALAEEKGRVEPWLASLTALEQVVAGSAELRDALANPVYAKEERRALAGELARALGFDEEPRNLIWLLADRGRLESLLGVVDHFRALADQKMGRVRAHVISAVPLAEAAARQIAARLEHAARAEVILDRAVDPSILGGVIAQVGSLTYDGSVRTQLEALRRSLTQ